MEDIGDLVHVSYMAAFVVQFTVNHPIVGGYAIVLTQAMPLAWYNALACL